jgi:tRNA 2-selenouridine synthase SelU
MLAKKYGGKGESCTRGRLKSEQVPQWLRSRNGEDSLIAAGSAFSAAKIHVSPRSLIKPYHSSALLALNCPTPYVKHWNTSLIKF